MSKVKERAQRFKRLLADETFQEIIEFIKGEQIAVFLDSSATIEDVDKAREVVLGVEEVQRVIRAAIDDEAMENKKQS
jgi:hypothetical protein